MPKTPRLSSFDDAPVRRLPLFQEEEWSPIRRILRLSPRESEIVLGLLAGETETVIAERLGISTHTVHCHLRRLYRKLRVNSRPDMLIRIFNVHLVLARQPR